MYERFYNLRERPFSLSPDPDYLYPSRVHTEALNYLRYGIEGHAGFVVITGEIGSGKTTLLQAALRSLDKRTAVARLVNTALDARELIEAVMLDFGLEPAPAASKPLLLRDLARFLVDQRQAGRLALLIIDEAQNLSLSALEEVRMLSNLETEKSKLIQIVLVGQPNLHDVMGSPALEQLRQRVTVRYHLRPLDTSETAAYIHHRLKKAAIGPPMLFPPDATDLIGRYSEGLPRKINVIADAVLLFGYGEDKRTIDAPLVRDVLGELEATGVIIAPASAGAPAAPQPPAAPIGGSPARHAASHAPTAATPVAAAPAMSASVAAAMAERDRDMAAREARIAARERELAEQQRILSEQYRLLKAREAQAAAAVTTAAWPPKRPAPATASSAPPSRAAASPPQYAGQTPARGYAPAPYVAPPQGQMHTPAPAIFSAAEPVGFWARVRRAMLGVGKPLFED
jgi:putative secretion ATPase (PEP-CTERM system associated)